MLTTGTKTDFTDSSYAVRAVEDLARMFGKAPRGYAYDRGGYSTENVKRLRKLGVRDIGLAPLGRAPWEVEGKVKARLIRERAMVEGSIGTIKCSGTYFDSRDRTKLAKRLIRRLSDLGLQVEIRTAA